MSEYYSFVKKIGLVGLTNILVSISSILLLPILTKSFSAQDYGIWVQITVTIIIIPTILTLGLPEAMIRFLAAEKIKEKIREAFYSILFFDLIIIIISSIILLFLSESIGRLFFNNETNIAIILPLIIIFVSLNTLMLSFFRTFQQMKRYSLFTLMQSYLILIFVAYAAFQGYTIYESIIGLLIANIIVFIFMFVFILSNIGFQYPKFHKIKEYLHFSIPSLSNNLSSWIIDSSDRYVISIFLGTAFVGYYSPSYTIAYIITLFATPFYVLLLSVISKYYEENKIMQVKTLMKFSIKYFLAATIPLAFVLWLLSKPILTLFTTPEIAANGYLVTPFIAVSNLLLGTCLIISQIIILKKKTKIIGMIGIITALLNLILNILLVPSIGIIGAAVVTLISYLVLFVFTLFYSLKCLHYEIDLRFTIKSIIASIIMSLFIFYLYPQNNIELIIITGSSLIIYSILIIALKGITNPEIKFFKELISK